MEADKFQSVELRKYNGPVAGVKILVVDADSTSLAIVSKMLHTIGYEVVTAALASDALSIIEEKKDELNLVLVEARLPDMEIHELTEKIKESSDLPSFIMTADENLPSISRALSKGAKLCFRKPVTISDLRGLWRFAMWNRNSTIASEEIPGFEWHQSEVFIVNMGLECQPSMNTGNQSLQSAKGKEQELLDKDNEGEKTLKRKRVTWTDDLQNKFMKAVESAGINAPPKKIYQLMNVPELTKANVSNYLQKYRQSVKQRANEIQQLGNADLCLTDNDRGKRSKFLQQQGVTNNPAFQGNNQKDLSNCMPVQILGPPANHPSQVNSSGQKPSFGQNQLCLPLKLQGGAHTASGFGETMNNVNGEVSANISQVKNTTDGKVSNDDTSLSWANSAAGRHEAQTLLANDIYQPIPPQLPVNLLPPEEKEHGIFGVEAGKIYEIFYSKGTQLFSDEDLKMWLSRFNSS